MLNGEKCVEKKKTKRKPFSMNLSYGETLKFNSDYSRNILKLTIWGNNGKLNRKIFMGIVQISLDDLKLSNYVEGWYTLWDLQSNWDNHSLTEDEFTYLKI